VTVDNDVAAFPRDGRVEDVVGGSRRDRPDAVDFASLDDRDLYLLSGRDVDRQSHLTPFLTIGRQQGIREAQGSVVEVPMRAPEAHKDEPDSDKEDGEAGRLRRFLAFGHISIIYQETPPLVRSGVLTAKAERLFIEFLFGCKGKAAGGCESTEGAYRIHDHVKRRSCCGKVRGCS